MKKSIVVIMAHADDIELSSAGGTLAKYISMGYKGLYGVLSRCNSGWKVDEEKGRHYISSLEIVPQRRAEGASAAKVFGAEYYQADLLENYYTRRDGTYILPSFKGSGFNDDDVPEGDTLFVASGAGSFLNHPVIDEVTELLVKYEPELVIGQAFQNNNPDHFAAGLILAKAWKKAREKVKIGPYWTPVDNDEEFYFPKLIADKFVDITGFEDKDIEALCCHKSQGGYLAFRHEILRKKWSETGKKWGCKSAEEFSQVYD